MKSALFIATALVLLSIGICQADTLVLDNRSLRSYTPPEPNADTKLVTLKGEPASMDKEDICAGSKRHICSHVGLVAHVGETEAAIGRITGVAWKHEGATIGRALDTDGVALTNALAPRDAYYYIVQSPAEGVILIESASAFVR